MIAVAVGCFVLAVVAGIAWWRAGQRLDALQAELRTMGHERDASRTDAAAASADAARTAIERDDAHERVQRARRDAAEVANRLRDESAARAVAEGALEEESERRTVVAAELDEARARLAQSVVHAGDSPDAGTVGVLSSSTLARVEQIWRTSISLGLDRASPLDGADDPLRTAVEIVIEAAREEAGADIDLQWTPDAPMPVETGLVVLALVESIIAAVAKAARSTGVHVGYDGDDVEVRFDSVDDDGETFEIEVPAALAAGPGRALIRGGRRDR